MYTIFVIFSCLEHLDWVDWGGFKSNIWSQIFFFYFSSHTIPQKHSFHISNMNAQCVYNIFFLHTLHSWYIFGIFVAFLCFYFSVLFLLECLVYLFFVLLILSFSTNYIYHTFPFFAIHFVFCILSYHAHSTIVHRQKYVRFMLGYLVCWTFTYYVSRKFITITLQFFEK
jgi:hypothetical protein